MGDVPPLTRRITIALNEVRTARTDGDLSRELAWMSVMDRLIGIHSKLLRANGKLRPLVEVDPELDARLTVRIGIKLVGNPLLAPTA